MTHHNRLTQPTRYRDCDCDEPVNLSAQGRLVQAVGWLIVPVVVALVVAVVVSVPLLLAYGLSRVLTAWGWL